MCSNTRSLVRYLTNRNLNHKDGGYYFYCQFVAMLLSMTVEVIEDVGVVNWIFNKPLLYGIIERAEAAIIKMAKSLLVAFDFDHTIVDGNTDIVARNLLPSSKIPETIEKLYRTDGWTTYMQEVFSLLHAHGIRKEAIMESIKKISVTPKMDSLLKLLKSKESEVIIVSDSNSVFINDWLSTSGLQYTVNEIFTNPARFNSDGCLNIEMYHLQDWCDLSTKNLCKGHIVDTYIKNRASQGVTFSRIAYVGDGKNDLCPVLRLSDKDFAFPRKGYALADILRDMQKKKEKKLKAKVYEWQSGDDITKVLSECLSFSH